LRWPIIVYTVEQCISYLVQDKLKAVIELLSICGSRRI